MLGSAESIKVGLISHEIISKNSNLYDHDTLTLQMDNLPWQYHAPLGFAR